MKSQITVYLLTNRWEIGGVRTHIMDLAEGLRLRGADVAIAAWDGGATRPKDVRFLALRLYGKGGRHKSLRGFFAAADRLRRVILSEEGPVIVHTHSRYTLPLAALAVRGTKAARVYTAHSSFSDLSFLPWYPRHIICPSESAAEAFRAHVRQAARCVLSIIPHGVADSGIRVARPRELPSSIPSFVFLGRLAAGKGGETLIDAAGRLALRDVDAFRIVVVGDGPDRDAWERRTRLSGIKSLVHFVGAVDDPRPFLQHAAALVFPSTDLEAAPMSVLEAMAARCPVLASDIPPLRELLADGQRGLLVTPGNADALAAGMERVLRDPAAFTPQMENAHAEVRARHSYETMLERTLDVYSASCGTGLPMSR